MAAQVAAVRRRVARQARIYPSIVGDSTKQPKWRLLTSTQRAGGILCHRERPARGSQIQVRHLHHAVEKVIRKQKAKGGTLEYFVRWKGTDEATHKTLMMITDDPVAKAIIEMAQAEVNALWNDAQLPKHVQFGKDDKGAHSHTLNGPAFKRAFSLKLLMMLMRVMGEW